jgi:tRNA threonylcarbamoyladenosine biosynthesis protein TsaB
MKPRLLLIETSGRAGWVAVAEGDRLCAARRLDEARRHGRDLAPAVAALLAEQGWQPRDVHAVLAGRGPGSYTGLRVGLMSAKVFAYATGCALIALDTFAIIAAQAPAEALLMEVIADAQQDKVYCQSYQRTAPGDSPAPAAALAILPAAEWLARLRPPVWVTGPGLHLHRARLPAGIAVVDESLWGPQPQSLLELGLARYQVGQRDDVWSAEPLYLRPSSAEEKWQARAAT